jgi:GNAT acetyltransferase-like protein
MPPRARLIEDGGAAASDRGHFFRSPEFLRAEGATHTLAIEGAGAALRLPVIVRRIEGGDRLDAISPYGYPGAAEAPEAPPDPTEVDWSETGLVSLFVRDRIGERACLAGGTVRAEVQVAEGEAGIRKRLREQIRRNERRGWTIESAPGPETGERGHAAFERAYAETMTRAGAAEHYFFSGDYFRELLSSPRALLLLARRDAAPEAGAIAVASDRYLHYFLGGTADEALEDSPMKNLFAAMISLAGELGLPLNLGGGVRPGDSLDTFKRGFATGSAPFRTHEVICDAEAYAELSGGPDSTPHGFFPAYRAP